MPWSCRTVAGRPYMQSELRHRPCLAWFELKMLKAKFYRKPLFVLFVSEFPGTLWDFLAWFPLIQVWYMIIDNRAIRSFQNPVACNCCPLDPLARSHSELTTVLDQVRIATCGDQSVSDHSEERGNQSMPLFWSFCVWLCVFFVVELCLSKINFLCWSRGHKSMWYFGAKDIPIEILRLPGWIRND
jgi:hypothetical protein